MRFLLSKLRIFLFFPIPYLSQPLNQLVLKDEIGIMKLIKERVGGCYDIQLVLKMKQTPRKSCRRYF